MMQLRLVVGLLLAGLLGGCWWSPTPLMQPSEYAALPLEGHYGMADLTARPETKAAGVEIGMTRPGEYVWNWDSESENKNFAFHVMQLSVPDLYLIEQVSNTQVSEGGGTLYWLAKRNGASFDIYDLPCKGILFGNALLKPRDPYSCTLINRRALLHLAKTFLVYGTKDLGKPSFRLSPQR